MTNSTIRIKTGPGIVIADRVDVSFLHHFGPEWPGMIPGIDPDVGMGKISSNRCNHLSTDSFTSINFRVDNKTVDFDFRIIKVWYDETSSEW